MGVSQVEIGSRIHLEGEYGTVLYIGAIQGVEGTWLGVEWDNISRGKHSGCYNGVTYFNTKIPNAGSFIKMSKADLGISFPKALRLKYGHESDSSSTPGYINLPQKAGPERHIEMIGMKKIMGKQSNYSALTDLVLSKMLVNSAGFPNEIKDLVPNIINLDLSENLLFSWTTIHEIVRQLEHLTSIVLSKNCLPVPKIPEYQECYKLLKIMILNNMSYSWNEILSCAVMWPYIEELSVQCNNIFSLESPVCPIFSKLKSLCLDNNCINSWTEICKLGNLESLIELHLDNTELDSITFSDVLPTENTVLFPNLETLFLRNNKLSKWEDINELNKLKKLENLMINNNPVFSSENYETVRQFIIAKIPKLKILNKMEIGKSERRGAEFDYIKKFYTDYLKDSNNKNVITSGQFTSFVLLHPTYHILLSKHGVPDENEVKSQSTLLKDNLISVKFVSSHFPNNLPIVKRLPGEMTIGKLRALVKRLFKIPTLEINLTLLYNEDNSQKTDLDNNLRQLSFYSVTDKDKIIVDW